MLMSANNLDSILHDTDHIYRIYPSAQDLDTA